MANMKLGFNRNGYTWITKRGCIAVKKMSDDAILKTCRVLKGMWEVDHKQKYYRFLEFFEAEASKRGLKLETLDENKR